jgi:hypothetical protein
MSFFFVACIKQWGYRVYTGRERERGERKKERRDEKKRFVLNQRRQVFFFYWTGTEGGGAGAELNRVEPA